MRRVVRSLGGKPWSWLLLILLSVHFSAAILRIFDLDVPRFGLVAGPVLWGFWQVSISSPLRRRLRYSPEWGYVSFFVPIANLFVPYLAMRDLIRVRTSGPCPSVAVWWLACLAIGVPTAVQLSTGYDALACLPAEAIELLHAMAALTAARVVHLASRPASEDL
jgi:hypothetical protein